jgi:tryptophan-rich sensory protein
VALYKRMIEDSLSMTAPRPANPMKQGLMFLLFLGVCFGTAFIGTVWTNASLGDWYEGLAKPTWNPPNWIFGPVWSVLYFLIACAGWLVWRTGRDNTAVWLLYGAQLLLNAAWSGIFFGWRNPGGAFLEILVLLSTIVATTVAFWRRSRWAGGLFVPYLAWCTFAAVLNFTVWRLNG